MISAFDAFSLPLMRWFDPEDAHRLAIQGLRLLPPVRLPDQDPRVRWRLVQARQRAAQRVVRVAHNTSASYRPARPRRASCLVH